MRITRRFIDILGRGYILLINDSVTHRAAILDIISRVSAADASLTMDERQSRRTKETPIKFRHERAGLVDVMRISITEELPFESASNNNGA